MKNKERIGILTLNGYNNYGNRLQNYALEKTIIKLDFEIETILVDRNKKRKKTSKNKILPLKKLPIKIYRKCKFYFNKKHINIRRKRFIDFSNKYLNEKDFKISVDFIPHNLSDKYDYFITGSDQVWNPNNLHGTTYFFLTFADKDKRIAYAPSFGVSEIEEKYKENYKKWLNGIKYISVREEAGVKIIKELTGRDAPVLVDPTMLLTKEEWLKISIPAPNISGDKKYLLTYFLGGVPNEYKRDIKNLAKKHNLDIVNLGDIYEKTTYRTGPSEFIDYINNCSILCTDSFHGTVFSILFKKPFIIYDRVGYFSMYSRINTVLDKFNFNHRKAENIKLDDEVFNMDFSHVDGILEKERKKSIDYLKKALQI